MSNSTLTAADLTPLPTLLGGAAEAGAALGVAAAPEVADAGALVGLLIE